MKNVFEWVNRVGSLVLIIFGLILIIVAIVMTFTFLGLAGSSDYSSLDNLNQRTFCLIFFSLINGMIGSACLISGVILKKKNDS